jgi:predicted component of type VI protein secretion system
MKRCADMEQILNQFRRELNDFGGIVLGLGDLERNLEDVLKNSEGFGWSFMSVPPLENG